jgi:hypothetical protein
MLEEGTGNKKMLNNCFALSDFRILVRWDGRWDVL